MDLISVQRRELAEGLLSVRGVRQFGEAALTDRAFDQNNDGFKDSGADFWTSYVFHTRDMVRQCTLDHMQLVKMIRSWDGVRAQNLPTSTTMVKKT